MKIVKMILAGIIFICMAYVSFQISLIFGIIFLASGIYSLIFLDAWERPGVSILWFAGGLICRLALSDILLKALKSETAIDIVVGLFAFGIVYLIGQQVKNG